jgi:hypothetical protein
MNVVALNARRQFLFRRSGFVLACAMRSIMSIGSPNEALLFRVEAAAQHFRNLGILSRFGSGAESTPQGWSPSVVNCTTRNVLPPITTSRSILRTDAAMICGCFGFLRSDFFIASRFLPSIAVLVGLSPGAPFPGRRYWAI